MIAPSPDWFLAVENFNLFDEQWIQSADIPVILYDDGTEQGNDFSINNESTQPRGTIQRMDQIGGYTASDFININIQRIIENQ
jgi:hypothetical protein